MQLKQFIINKASLLLWGVKYNPKRFWNAQGLVYQEAFEGRVKGDRQLSLILDTLETLGFASFLDVGCAFGYYLKGIRQRFPRVRLAGCDISATQIEKAKQYLDGSVELRETDGTLPYADKEFDVVFTYAVCGHVQDILPFLTDILRVGKQYLFIESQMGRDKLFYFSHDYEALFKEMGVKLEILKVFSKTHRLYLGGEK